MNYTNSVGLQYHPTSQRVFDLRGILTGCPSFFMTKKCEICGKEIKTCPSQNKRFCSRKCKGIAESGKNHYRWKGGKIKKYCEICGKEFKVFPSDIGKFCSRKCVYKLNSLINSKRIERICQVCGKKFFSVPSLVKMGRGKLCSWKCNAKWLYRGNQPYSQKARRTCKYEKWRSAVFKRDNFQCQFCGIRASKGRIVRLNAHHIKSFADFTKKRFNINNGITLCKKCHKDINKKMPLFAIHSVCSN